MKTTSSSKSENWSSELENVDQNFSIKATFLADLDNHSFQPGSKVLLILGPLCYGDVCEILDCLEFDLAKWAFYARYNTKNGNIHIPRFLPNQFVNLHIVKEVKL